MSEALIEVDDAGFESQVLQSGKPILVDFWAPWCGPCRTFEPLVEELAEKFGAQMTFAKCNVDYNPLTPEKYGIKFVPTLIFFKEGKVAEQLIGMMDKSNLETAIQRVI
jgi:thioredoxin 1